ncbi:hypothetical protein Q427_18750 [Halomonas sp. BC04]|nr:hypothetical protein Q427_18750 [Halomonas sp. BC04]
MASRISPLPARRSGCSPRLRPPRSTQWLPSRETRHSRHHQVANAAAVTPSCSTAPAEAMKRWARSGSWNQVRIDTDSVGGRVGPRISATSTTEVA